jgi:hypothetical protein
MAVLTCDVLLQVEQADGTFRCWAFTGVPAARPSWIALVSTGSATGLGYLSDLETELKTILHNSSPEITEEEVPCTVLPSQMNAADYPTRRKLLVLAAAQDAPFQDVPWYNNWSSDDFDAAVMTVIPGPNLQKYLSEEITAKDHLLRRTNAKSWSGDTPDGKISEVVPALLSLADISSQMTRIFISYRRLETLPVALQLFDRLIHEGFEVFLDRFTIPPGFDFQRRLNQELEDKSMVILLESLLLKNSDWTLHEINFAKRFRLGLACVRMPDVKDEDILPALRGRPRFDLNGKPKPDSTDQPPSDFEQDPLPRQDLDKEPAEYWMEHQRLTKAAEDRVVTFIKREHANALFARRQRLRTDVANAFAANGIQVMAGSVGPLSVQVGDQQHLIWITTRPPEVDDFRNLHGAHLARVKEKISGRGALVGPQAALEPDRRKRLTWLEERTECLSFDEAKLSEFASKVASWK